MRGRFFAFIADLMGNFKDLPNRLTTKDSKNWRKKALPIAGLAFAIFLSLTLCQFPLDNLESFLYDLRIRFSPTSPTSGMVKTVAVTKESLRTLGNDPTAKQYAELFQKISEQKPKAIISLLRPDEISGSAAELKQLAETLNQLPDFYVLGGMGDYPAKGLEDHLRLPPPFNQLFMGMGSYTSDGIQGKQAKIFGRDYVTRRLLLTHRDRLTKLPEIVNQAMNRPDDFHYRGAFPFLHSQQVYIDFRPSNTYPQTAFHEILQKETPSADFKDKFVIVGLDTESRSSQYSSTPFDREILAMTNVEVHANILDTLILDRGRLRLPLWADKVITAGISLITLYIVLAAKPTIGLVALIATLFTFSLISYLLMAFAGVWVVMIHPYLAIFICYYFSIPYRLIMENRRSWEYYQKHKLLKEVEELKTNFLSMMSHDLKTPIARIQGMADVLKSGQQPLNSDQTEAVDCIKESAEELSGFITTVLDLGRIENQKVSLKIRSKDINTLLEEVIKRHDFMAKKKKVQIVADFEPLFSTKMDVDLMKQVFANLIENAIKYSPENSKVLVSTEEAEGKIVVQVADQGQGIPPADLANIFMKFYRSRDARSSAIKGSGLGLYLAKYFVDLHHGKIFVESTPQVGSTFTVEIPTENATSL